MAIFLDCECPSAFFLVPLGPFALQFFLPPTAPALRQAHHPEDPPQGEGRGLFTAPPEQNQCDHLPCETVSQISEVRCLHPVSPLQTSCVTCFVLSFGLAQAEAESACEWHSTPPFPPLLCTSKEFRESMVPATPAGFGF